jgi:non-specific serine/threonine protein kinase
VKSAGRGVSSDRDADRLIAQAKQTRAYVQFLVRQSTAASR